VKKLLVILVFFLLCLFSFSQDPQFTQFYSSPLYLAPSFAGATPQHRIATTYRNQWPSIPGTFVTYTFSYDHFFDNFNSGLGLLISRDVAGSGNLSTTNIGIQYSYDIKLTDFWHLRPGIHVLYTQRGIDFHKLIWGDQISPSGIIPTIEVPSFDKRGDIDASVSLLTYSDRVWIGAAVDHLFRPNYSLSEDVTRLPMKYSLFGGYQLIRKGRLIRPIEETLSISGLLKHQGLITQLDLGVYWYKKPIIFGLGYRGIPLINREARGDAICFLIGYKIEQFRVGYSYDFTINRLLPSTGGAHEIALIYEFSSEGKKRRRRMVPCRDF